MIIKTFENEEDWLEARGGKITGTRAGNLFSKRDKKPLKGYYELIAERVAIPATGEMAMDRGRRLEEEAVARFAKETGKVVTNNLELWMRDDNEDIAVSPDGVVEGGEEVAEVKCLDSANHLKAYLENKIPSDYEHQVLQHFIVNDILKKLYFVFYDPRMPKDFFWIEVTREEKEDEIKEFLEMEQRVLAEIKEIVTKLTF